MPRQGPASTSASADSTVPFYFFMATEATELPAFSSGLRLDRACASVLEELPELLTRHIKADAAEPCLAHHVVLRFASIGPLADLEFWAIY
ncbi:hypothetical protein CIB48_g7535 [Xylaria polymorpha]|nr:hypothetical protein CIB48_g7535 [Xylaria polymorpha]